MPSLEQNGKPIPQFVGWISLDFDKDPIKLGDVICAWGDDPTLQGSSNTFSSDHNRSAAEVYSAYNNTGQHKIKYIIYRKDIKQWSWIQIGDNIPIDPGDFLGVEGLDPNLLNPNTWGNFSSGIIANGGGGYAREGRTSNFYTKDRGYKVLAWRKLPTGTQITYRRFPPHPSFSAPLPLP